MKNVLLFAVLAALVIIAVLWWIGREADAPAGTPEQSINFRETGNIVGGEEGKWEIVYEKPGMPALRAVLEFGEQSFCSRADDDHEISCEAPTWDIGERVRVEGLKTSTGIEVVSMVLLDK